jgi:hypothetical protein
MDEYGIEHHPRHVFVDCRNADAAIWLDRSRGLAMACIRHSVDRVLVDATDCDPEGHFALRDALTALMLAGMPPGFRLALVTDVSHFEAFYGLQHDLHWLNIPLRCFEDAGDAQAWLLRETPPTAVARPSRARQQA